MPHASGDASAFAPLHTADVALDYTGAPSIRGTASNQEFISGLFKAMSCQSVTVDAPDIPSLGDAVMQSGRYSETVTLLA
jgi:hypothetical protein